MTDLQPIACPGCGYDLRGLPRGRRCPECGRHPAFHGPRRISPKLARRIDRRLLFPPLAVLMVLSMWGTAVTHAATTFQARRDTASMALFGFLGAAVLGWFLYLDLRRSRRRRRGGLALYLALQGVVLTLIVLVSTLLAAGVIPVPRRDLDPPYVAAVLGLLVLETFALSAAAWQVPATLRRRQRPAFEAAVFALLFAPAAAFVATGCCVLPGLVRESISVSLALLAAAAFARYAFRRLRESVGIKADPPPPPKPFLWPLTGRRRRPKRLVLHPGEKQRGP